MSRLNENLFFDLNNTLSFPTNEEKSSFLFPKENDLKSNYILNNSSFYNTTGDKFLNNLCSNEKMIEIFDDKKIDSQLTLSENSYQVPTKKNSNKEMNKPIKIIEKTKKIERRDLILDFFNKLMYYFVKWIVEEINKKLKSKGIIHKKILKPSKRQYHLLFEKMDYLSLSCSDIVEYSTEKYNQRKNDEIIERIYKNPEKYKDLIFFIEDSLTNSIINFYDSENFKTFKNEEQNKQQNKIFYEQSDISLLDGYGLIDYIDSLNKNKG